jgi:hypothetical protein
MLILLLSAVAIPLCYGDKEEKLEITGNLRNRNFYFNVSGSSLLNPNNILEIPRVGNNLRLELFLDSEVSETAKVYLSSRLYHSTIKQEEEYRAYLDEAYIDVNFNNRMMLRTGKQRTVWGTGMAWNPSDVLNPQKDPTDPVEQKEGILSTKFDIPLRGKWGILQSPAFTAVLVPEVVGYDISATHRSQGALKFYFLTGGFDIHLISSFVEDKEPMFGLATSGVLFDVLELHGEAIFQKGAERYYITNDNQISQNKLNSDNVFSKWLIGTRYTLPRDIVFLAEYYHIDEGYNKNEMQNYLNFLRSGNKSKLSLLPQRDLRKNYILISWSRSNLWDTFNTSSRIIANLDDSSFIWSSRYEYIRITNVGLAIERYYFRGKKESEFGNASADSFISFEVSLYF